METKAQSNRITSIVALYDIQTRYYLNALEGISDKDAHSRLNTKANHVAWLAGSLVEQRFDMASHLGIAEKALSHELFKDNQGIKDNVTYPSLQQYRDDWTKISPLLRDALLKVSDETLDQVLELMPGMKFTVYELVCFNTYREASCIGQIALWRRLLGYDPMRYM